MALITWPENIPLPFVDFTGAPRNGTIASGPNRGQIWRRSRFASSFVSLQVTWRLSQAQYDRLEALFRGSLHNGTRRFSVELRYPLNSALNTWDARFAGGLDAGWRDGIWDVTAALDLVRKTS